ncbi:MAG: tRNA (guanosine(46)-N7)-methyltransferase TrmB [Bacteroidales bacterium]|nr:tRNA (guanosine(46)-N7)-methyltransferase TrmB [Bacteroidales bacterium]
MAKHKLQRFAENKTFGNLFQHTDYDREQPNFPLRGRWREDYFHNDHPIVLELGCGKGDYTLALARRNPNMNYIGIDRKGARLWRGCKDALEEQLANVAFLRITIDKLSDYFAPGEVDEIWVTFPDPQLKHERKRLVSPRFVGYYKAIMKDGGGVLNLKTDSRELYAYVCESAEGYGWQLLESVEDVYQEPCDPILTEVQTFYERMWLTEGRTISYVKMKI